MTETDGSVNMAALGYRRSSQMRLEINDDDLSGKGCHPQVIRAAAYFLLHAIGDIKDDSPVEYPVPGTTATTSTPPAPPVAPAATAPAVNTVVASAAANTSTISPTATVPAPVSSVPPPPPPILNELTRAANGAPPPPPPPPVSADGYGSSDDESESNVVHGNFPQAGSVPPPPPVSNGTGATTAGPPSPTPSFLASGAAAALNVVSAEVDSAGMMYDARIHQKAKSKKKDGTWKLIKGIEEKSPGLVQAVTAELAARKGASAPVSLPAPPNFAPGVQAPGPNLGTNTVPVPPVTNVPTPPGVPAPPAGGSSSPVPVPPSPAVGSVGNPSAYRALIDKITDLTRQQKISPAKVSEICQSHGAPSLMALNSMQDQKSARDSDLTIIEAVSRDIDAAALGLL